MQQILQHIHNKSSTDSPHSCYSKFVSDSPHILYFCKKNKKKIRIKKKNQIIQPLYSKDLKSSNNSNASKTSNKKCYQNVSNPKKCYKNMVTYSASPYTKIICHFYKKN